MLWIVFFLSSSKGNCLLERGGILFSGRAGARESKNFILFPEMRKRGRKQSMKIPHVRGNEVFSLSK